MIALPYACTAPTDAWVDVNEPRLHADGSTQAVEWLALFCLGLHQADRVSRLTLDPQGERTRIYCADADHAARMQNLLIEHGVPASAIRIGAAT